MTIRQDFTLGLIIFLKMYTITFLFQKMFRFISVFFSNEKKKILVIHPVGKSNMGTK